MSPPYLLMIEVLVDTLTEAFSNLVTCRWMFGGKYLALYIPR